MAQKAVESAGITHSYSAAKHASPHLFRQSLARHLKSGGYTVKFLQKFLRHSTITTTMHTQGILSLGEMQQMIAQKTGDYPLIRDAKAIRRELLHRT